MPYYNTEWLFGVALYGVYSLGGLGAVVVFKASLLAVTAALLWRTAILAPDELAADDGLHDVLAVAVVLAALLAMRYRFVERPDVVLMVFVAATVYALDAFIIGARRRALYLLVPMAVVWARSSAKTCFFGSVSRRQKDCSQRVGPWKNSRRRSSAPSTQSCCNKS